MCWVEVDGAGWRCMEAGQSGWLMEAGAQFSNKHIYSDKWNWLRMPWWTIKETETQTECLKLLQKPQIFVIPTPFKVQKIDKVEYVILGIVRGLSRASKLI